MPKSTEKNTQKSILEYLTAKRIFHFRQNSGAFKTESGGFYRMGAVGCPDIICVVGGQFIGIEVKDIKGRLNENQVRFKEDLERAGGIYIVARSIDDILNSSLFS